jgi:pullulanase-type alpha-1,6-glucosidase
MKRWFRWFFVLMALMLAASGFAPAQEEGPQEGSARIHYHRPDGDYEGWELHVWEDTTESVTWEDGLDIAAETDYGVYWDVALTDGARRVGFIVHRGDDKDPGPDMFLNLEQHGNEIWLVSGSDNIYSEQPDPDNLPAAGPALAPDLAPDLALAKAHWVSESTIAWPLEPAEGATYALHYEPDGDLAIADGEVRGGQVALLSFDRDGLSDEVLAKFPHLEGYTALRVGANDLRRIPDILQGRMAVSMTAGGALVEATGLQIPGVLDDLYTYDGDLGIVWEGDAPTLKLWAPTAKSVSLHLFDGPDAGTALEVLDLERDEGVWSIAGEPDWKGRYYLYEVEVYTPVTGQVERNLVTDPYSLSLAMNSARSQLVDLGDAEHKPESWDVLEKPALEAFNDVSIYEIHLRDFSISDETVNPENRGKYTAFTEADTNGVRHLRSLAEAGLSHLHLLPTFDIATIDEDENRQVNPSFEELAEFPPDSTGQRDLLNPVRDQDGFNWGYDPFHFNVPEGSYATDANGPRRILEYREMVQAINGAGLRVVKDVVYNHTNAAGQSERSVFDRIVPGYYHRLDENGAVTTSTCCPNTATEHAMMEKFMVDSVVFWATAYKIDAFRFDLMGHHMRDNMVRVREALDALTLEEDGVDGARIYLYGEGWNFGEVADNARGVNATQLNVGGLGIGTFNDRMRDAIRGGGPFDAPGDIIRNQGFISGLSYDPNPDNPMNDNPLGPGEAATRLLHYADLIRVGLTGNLRDYSFTDRSGETVTGFDIDYNGAPAGYTESPQEAINYVEKHDNQTLFDQIVMKAPVERTVDERVRMQNLGASMVMLGQGVPFFHAGQDMLRSKSLERDSYNSGDWFNRLDFSLETNNFGVGLPPNVAEADFPYLRPYLADENLVPEPVHILRAAEHFQEMLRVRYSSPLFRLRSAEEVMARLEFHNTGPEQTPGLIVMSLSDKEGEDLDPEHDLIVVIFNATGEEVTFEAEAVRGLELSLHPVLAASSDAVVQGSSFDADTGAFTVPARTTAVFVEGAR